MAAKKRGQKNGPKNTNWRHGGFSSYMSAEDAEWIEGKRAEYIKAYPHLTQPAMSDLLDNYLRLLMQADRMWRHVMDPEYPADKVASCVERLTRLTRSCSLLGARMGVTYTSQRKQVLESEDGDKEVKLPEEILAEMTKRDK